VRNGLFPAEQEAYYLLQYTGVLQMAKPSFSTLPSTRVAPDIRDQFLKAAQQNHQTPSEAMREAALQYIKRSRNAELARQAANIRANREDEEDVMRWIEAHSVVITDD
jgi:predicted transcriptional regulator